MNRALDWLKTHPITAFVMTTFAFSWVVWSPLVISGQQASAGSTLLIIIGGFGPLLAAALVTWIGDDWQGVSHWWGRILQWKADIKLYLFSLLFPAVLAALAFGLYQLMGGLIPEGWSAPAWYVYPLSFLFVFFLGGGQEEPGWRGFALPKLQEKTSALNASLILGVIWACWHVPLFFAPASSQSANQLPFSWYVVHTVALSIVFTLLSNAGHGSVLLPMLLHAGLNAIASWLPLGDSASGPSIFSVMVILEGCVAIGLVISVGPDLLAQRRHDRMARE